MKRKLSRVGAAALLGVAVLAIPASASASPASDIANCLTSTRSQDSGSVWYQYDRCGGRAIKSRIRLSGAVDEACHTLRFNQGYREDWFVGSFDGVIPC
jgi:hypothetical protein